MGSVVPRKRKDGTIGYQAHVSIWRGGKPVHRETKTFDRKPAARAWIEKREAELERPGALEEVRRDDPPLSDVIERYTTESLKQIGRTKAQVLRSLKALPIAEKHCSQIESADLVSLARELASRMQPQTVGNYLSHLQAVFAIARPAWATRSTLRPCGMQPRSPGGSASLKRAISATGGLPSPS